MQANPAGGQGQIASPRLQNLEDLYIRANAFGREAADKLHPTLKHIMATSSQHVNLDTLTHNFLAQELGIAWRRGFTRQ